MQFSAALVAAFLAATATALPVAGEQAETAPVRARWGMPIIDHRPVDRRSPGVHVIDKIPVPEKRQEDEDEAEPVERRGRNRPIIDHRPVDRRSPGVHVSDKIPAPEKRQEDEEESAPAERRGRARPIIDHRPVDRRAEAAAAAQAETSSGSAIAKAFWGMPIINHIPYPGRR